MRKTIDVEAAGAHAGLGAAELFFGFHIRLVHWVIDHRLLAIAAVEFPAGVEESRRVLTEIVVEVGMIFEKLAQVRVAR